jgi:hypothetical protein
MRILGALPDPERNTRGNMDIATAIALLEECASLLEKVMSALETLKG